MPFLSQAVRVDDAGSGVVIDIRRGDTPAIQFTQTDDSTPPVPVDISQWDITVASARAFTARVGFEDVDADEQSVVRMLSTPRDEVPDPSARVVLPRVEKQVQTGVYAVHFPANFWVGSFDVRPNPIWAPVVLVMVDVRRPNGVGDQMPIQAVILYGSEV